MSAQFKQESMLQFPETGQQSQRHGGLRIGTCTGECPTAEAKKKEKNSSESQDHIHGSNVVTKSSAQGIKPGGNMEIGL